MWRWCVPLWLNTPSFITLFLTTTFFSFCTLRSTQARDLVRRSSGVERTRALAQAHADKAREVLKHLPESTARSALETLAEKVVKRTS